MSPKTMLWASALCAMALAGCTAGDDGGGSADETSTSTTGGVGVGGNATVGNTTVSGSFTATGTNSTGGGNGTGDAPMAAMVSIEGGQFVNQTVTVRSGGTVTWVHNDGSASHTVTADDASFDSNPNCSPGVGPLPPQGDCLTSGEEFSTTFSTPGTFSYHCKLHPSMQGTVTVVE